MKRITSYLLAVGATYVARAAIDADLVPSLPGFAGPLPSKLYSGYLDIPGGKHVHYTFQESTGNPATDPVVLWLNGGPGCSSLEGMFAESGLLLVAGANPFSEPTDPPSLLLNPYSWNNVTSMLYFESPVCVGFSWANEPAVGCPANDTSSAVDNLASLLAFFAGFPEYTPNPFFATGESYAGVYIPQLAKQIVLHNGGGGQPVVQLRGIAVGNGVLGHAWLNPAGTAFSYPRELQVYIPFYRGHALISAGAAAAVAAACPNASDPAPPEACYKAIEAAHDEIGPVDVYNVLRPCGPNSVTRSRGSSSDSDGSEDLRAPYSVLPPRRGESQDDAAATTVDAAAAGAGAGAAGSSSYGTYGPVTCLGGTALAAYLNQPDVQAALHVKADLRPWQVCGGTTGWNYTRTEQDQRLDTYPLLLSNNITVLIFNGDQDACIPHTDNELWTGLFAGATGMVRSAAWHPWISPEDGGVGGYATHWSSPPNPPSPPSPPSSSQPSQPSLPSPLGGGAWANFSFVTVKGAGHMVATYTPAASYTLMTAFFNGQQL